MPLRGTSLDYWLLEFTNLSEVEEGYFFAERRIITRGQLFLLASHGDATERGLAGRLLKFASEAGEGRQVLESAYHIECEGLVPNGKEILRESAISLGDVENISLSP